jgi:N-acetylglucosaminyl-diphospho-decaprenol L-rhamnosyltransferase
MTGRLQVSIVIVNYNTYDYTAQCLNSLRTTELGLAHEIVVVDNASSGDDGDRLLEHFPEIVLVRSRENRGIAGGNNLGIRAGHSRYVLLLNNDTLVEKGSIERAAQFLDAHPEAAGVGGNLLNADGSFQSGYVDFPSLWSEFLFATHLELLSRPSFSSRPPAPTAREVDWMSTAFMLFRRDALEAVGFVDEEFFIYSDETDLEYRLKQARWKIYYLPQLNTIHFGGKSLTPWRRRRMLYRGKLLFFRNHYGRSRTAILRLLFAVTSLLKAIAWTGLGLIPRWRHRARLESASHREVVQLCFRLE